MYSYKPHSSFPPTAKGSDSHSHTVRSSHSPAHLTRLQRIILAIQGRRRRGVTSSRAPRVFNPSLEPSQVVQMLAFSVSVSVSLSFVLLLFNYPCAEAMLNEFRFVFVIMFVNSCWCL